MIYLIAAIVLNVLISSIFKVFPRYKINTLQAIVANYFVCVATGCVFMGANPFTPEVVHQGWFPVAMGMGVWFFLLFNLIGYCTRIDGITTTTIANKLSLVIPVLFSLILYHEHTGFLKITGILLAFPAIYLTASVKGEDNRPQNLLWPGLLFIGGGILDTMMNYVQRQLIPTPADQALFTLFCFASAGIIGTILVFFFTLSRKITFEWRNILAGICIGIPNYFSIYYYIRALHSGVFQSSATIPVMNIGIVVTAAFTAILIFREKANTMRILGLVLSIIAILLIATGDK